jgi:hypothetical protein
MPLGAAIGGTVVSGAAAVGDYRNNKKNRKSAERQRAESQAFIEKQMKQARGDLFRMQPLASESRRLGAQAGLDLMAQTVPQQLGAFKAGNMGAQRIVSQGLPQMQNAILGRGINTNFQPVDVGGEFQVPQLPQQVLVGGE